MRENNKNMVLAFNSILAKAPTARLDVTWVALMKRWENHCTEVREAK
jgi:hypothetical protein